MSFLPQNNPHIYRSIAKEDTDTLILVFGAIGQFNLIDELSEVKANKIFYKDPHCIFYYRGIPYVCENVFMMLEYLKQEVEYWAPKKLITMGLSTGGYNAIFFGYHLKADIIYSFYPPITFDYNKLSKFDKREINKWNKKNENVINIINKLSEYEKKLFEISEYEYTDTTCNIYYSKYNPIDKCHAELMANKKNVNLFPFATEKHTAPYLLMVQNDGFKKLFE